MREPSLKRLLEGRIKAFQNATDLIRDAEILYSKKRWARCVFLSSIALEEFGKYLMIIGAIGDVLRDKINWKRFWKRFRQHLEKTGNVLTFDVFLGPFISGEDTLSKVQRTFQEAGELEEKKMRSLYLDFNSGKFVLPMEIVDEKAAKVALKSARAVREVLGYGETHLFSKLTIAKLGEKRFRARLNKLFAKYALPLPTDPSASDKQ